ncbi:SRPBCC domain-containing protein [Actinomarinicola tropica]|uniref:Polyketide cyclase n=1 Tax=Actinomarinicola tropica TaxID=2789776 RepID=A0A5Q2RK67_9ACTN|nr:SRPBCC domain-containing protein [Actinomarinicola tropica]QGG94250.1 polyketide cyclase [Actinomarinicola tropica]
MKDLIQEIEHAERTLRDGTLPAGAAKVVVIERTYDADIDDVWDAITSPERIPRWFLPITGELRLGGHYQLEGNAGGEIRVCEAPTRLQVTWIFGEAPGPEDSSIVEVRLRSDATSSTTLTLEHSAVVPPEMWDQFGPGAVGVGWDLALLGLAGHLDGVDMGSPEQADADPAIQAAMRASSAAWGRASEAAGVAADVAAGWERATTDFYVPPSDEGATG